MATWRSASAVFLVSGVVGLLAAFATKVEAAGAGTGASCSGLAATCGSSAMASCCESAPVPGGTFKRLNDGVFFKAAHLPATVSAFRLDTYEITVGRFRKFLAGYPGNMPSAGTGKNPNNPADPGWDAAWNGPSFMKPDAATLAAALKCDATFQTWTDSAGGNESRPMNCISWYEAFAFCIWDGGRLPTEAEWNYAATGGAEQRVYPWSAPPKSTSISDSFASYTVDPDKKCFGDGVKGCALTDLVNVGSKPAGNGRWGHADLAGNVWEWTRDALGPIDPACADCATLDVSQKYPSRAARGGAFNMPKPRVMANERTGFTPASRGKEIGARCARKP
ncbi:MAG: SUMF1/EgtB/PvdO family nonheme iron enzyme [Myxococcales bacterium]|nr:SUMF1/EgtB/PvdO family nonheme iron enzyme [Myxococcales bacterium]